MRPPRQRDLNAKDAQRIVGELKKMGLQVVEHVNMTPFRSIVYGPVRQAYVEKNGADLVNAIEGEK